MRTLLRKIFGTHGPTIIGRSLDFFRRHHDELERGIQHCQIQMADNQEKIAALDGENQIISAHVKGAETMKAAISQMLNTPTCN